MKQQSWIVNLLNVQKAYRDSLVLLFSLLLIEILINYGAKETSQSVAKFTCSKKDANSKKSRDT